MTDHRTRLLEFLATLPSVSAANGRLQLDSLALLQVIAYLEQACGIRLSDHDVEADDLRSVDGIVSLMERFTDGGGADRS